MRTVILKPFLLVTLLFATAFATLNANDIINGGEIKVEVHQGFTIEDIIQDLHDNANIIVTVGTIKGAVVSLKYDAKIIDTDVLLQSLDAHQGVSIIYEK